MSSNKRVFSIITFLILESSPIIRKIINPAVVLVILSVPTPRGLQGEFPEGWVCLLFSLTKAEP